MPNPWLFDPARVSTSPTRRSKSKSPVRPWSSPAVRRVEPDSPKANATKEPLREIVTAPVFHRTHSTSVNPGSPKRTAAKRKPKQRPSTSSPLNIKVVTQDQQPFGFAFHQAPPRAESMLKHAAYHKSYVEHATKEVSSWMSPGTFKYKQLHGLGHSKEALPEFRLAKTLKRQCNLTRLQVMYADQKGHDRFVSKARSVIDSGEPVCHRRYNDTGQRTMFRYRHDKRVAKERAFEQAKAATP